MVEMQVKSSLVENQKIENIGLQNIQVGDVKEELQKVERNEKAYQFFNNVLNAPKHIMGPMVDQSELAFRMLGRRHGCHLCYSPMYHARLFHQDTKYREEMFSTIPEDRPLIVQFCANDPDHLLAAAKLVEDCCDAIDINLGCPQGIAKRGHYGSFLQDEWELVSSLVKKLKDNLKIPVTCKIRIFPELEKTLKYAKMLELSGCSVLTVHGRIREQKGLFTGLADWYQIKAVKESLGIPVIANGNISFKMDVDRCLKLTGCDAIMAAEGILYNPAIFTGKYPAAYTLAEEYLEIAKAIPNSAHLGAIKGHVFKILHASIPNFPDLRVKLSKSHTVDQFMNVVQLIKEKTKEQYTLETEFIPNVENLIESDGSYNIPVWAVQPYLRSEFIYDENKYVFDPSGLKKNIRLLEKQEREQQEQEQETETENILGQKREINDFEENIDTIDDEEGNDNNKPSRKLMKKLARKQAKLETKCALNNKSLPVKNQNKRPVRIICLTCKSNVASGRCDFTRCKDCCKKRFEDDIKPKLIEDSTILLNNNKELNSNYRIIGTIVVNDSKSLIDQGICKEHNKYLLAKPQNNANVEPKEVIKI